MSNAQKNGRVKEGPFSVVNSFINHESLENMAPQWERQKGEKIKNVVTPYSCLGCSHTKELEYTQPSQCAGGKNLSPCREELVILYVFGFPFLGLLWDFQVGARSGLCAKGICHKKAHR